MQFFNPYDDIRFTENRLPHWQQNGAVYFLTFRLADSVPTKLRNQWKEERAAWCHLHPQPWSFETEQEYHRRFSSAMERCLDEGHGSCLLRQREYAETVGNTLRHFDADRIAIISFVIMPNHVHALFVQNSAWPLEIVVRSWKGFSAREINKMRRLHGSIWQRAYFDRLVRDGKHFANCVRYIRRNPEKAKLSTGKFILYESETAKDIPRSGVF